MNVRSVILSIVCVLAVTAICVPGVSGRGRNAGMCESSVRAKARHYYLEGARHAADMEYGEAYELYRRAYDIDSTYGDASMMYASLNMPASESAVKDSVYQDKVLTSARRLVEMYPEDFFAVYHYAHVRSRMGDVKEAIRVLERYHSLKPGDTGALQALTDLYLDNYDYDKSLERLDEYRRIEGEDIQLSLRKAGILLAMGDSAGIVDEALRLIETNPLEPMYWVFKGRMEDFIGRKDSAIESLNQALKISEAGGGGAARIQLSRIYKERGDSVAYDQNVYEALIADDLDFQSKRDLLLYYIGGQIYDSVDNSGSSRGDRLVETVLKQYPHTPEVQIIAASYYSLHKHNDKALELAQYAIDLEPSNEEYRRHAMRFAFFAKKRGVVDAIYAAAKHDLKPLGDDTELMYIRLLAEFGDTEAALRKLQNLVSDKFPDIELDKPLDTSLLSKDVTAADLDILEEIYSTAGDLHNRGTSFDAAGYVCYDNALMLSPDDALVLNNYAYFLVRDPEAHVSDKDKEKAVDFSTRAVRLDPQNPTYLDTKAWALYRSGKVDEAREVMDAALEMAENSGMEISSDYYFHLGEILSALGDLQGAREAYEKALQLIEKEEKDEDSNSPVMTAELRKTKGYIESRLDKK